MLYRELVTLYQKLDSTTKRLEKTKCLSEFIKTVNSDVNIALLLVEGKIFPAWDETKTGISSKLVIKAISKATGASLNEIEEHWKKLGDLGDVAQTIIRKKKQYSLFPKKLTIKYVYDSLRSLADMEGKGSVEEKLILISEMLINATPEEAKYIVRTVVDNLRIGVGSSTIRDALVWAYFSDVLEIHYNKETNVVEISGNNRTEYNTVIEKVQHAYDLTNDWALVASKLRQGLESLDKVTLATGKPINVMLFQKARNIEDAFSIVGKPGAFEYKYDGFRMQLHIDEQVKIFTRRLEDVTKQFPEVVGYLKEFVKAKSCILDTEAVGYDPKTKEYMPFQNISQRIRRKHNIQEMAELWPVELNVFDIVYFNGKSLINQPFKKRRKLLEKIIVQKPMQIVLAKQLVTSSKHKAQKFFEESLEFGEEGVMAKNLESVYKPGSRVGYGVKVKSIMEPLDLVIIAAEYGEGKRSGWLTSFHLACSDKGELREIGKVSTGLKELEQEGTTFHEMTNLLNPLIIKSAGRYVKVKPQIVIEVGYEEIQKSPTYSSGYALRFPRFKRLRTEEKKVKDINTLNEIEDLYKQQRGRSNFKNN